MSSAREHRAAARDQLDRAEANGRGNNVVQSAVATAQVHALLALSEDLSDLVALTKKGQRR